jgi:hypothetical protein
MDIISKLLILIMLFLSTAYCSDPAITKENAGLSIEKPGSFQQLNESSYKQAMDRIWRQYNDDLDYSSLILDQFVRKNISSKEAFISTISIYVLNKETLNAINLITPPESYRENHNISKSLLIDIGEFYWNMAKYYETEDRIYAVQARIKYNESSYYYDLIHISNSSGAS